MSLKDLFVVALEEIQNVEIEPIPEYEPIDISEIKDDHAELEDHSSDIDELLETADQLQETATIAQEHFVEGSDQTVQLVFITNSMRRAQLKTGLESLPEPSLEGIVQTAKAFWDALIKALKGIWAKVVSFFKGLFDGLTIVKNALVKKTTWLEKLPAHTKVKAMTNFDTAKKDCSLLDQMLKAAEHDVETLTITSTQAVYAKDRDLAKLTPRSLSKDYYMKFFHVVPKEEAILKFKTGIWVCENFPKIDKISAEIQSKASALNSHAGSKDDQAKAKIVVAQSNKALRTVTALGSQILYNLHFAAVHLEVA